MPTMRPALVAVVALWLGHFLAAEIAGVRDVLWLASAAVCAMAGAALRRQATIAVVAIALVAMCLGAAQRAHGDRRTAATAGAFAAIQVEAARLAQVRGRIAALPRATRSGWMLRLAPGAQLGAGGSTLTAASPVMVHVAAGGDSDALLRTAVPGDRIEAWGRAVAAARELELAPEDAWLHARGAPVFVRARSIAVTEAREGAVASVLRWVQRGGALLETRIVARMGAEQGGLLCGLLLGRVQGVEDARTEAFRRAGLWHFFSVSGTHTVLVGAMTLGLLTIAGVDARARLAVFIPLLVAFAVVSGLQPPVIRAAVLMAAVAAGAAMERETDGPSALAMVAGVMLVLAPELAFAPDFQMTVLCAVALAFLSPWMVALDECLGPRLGWGAAGWLVLHGLRSLIVSVVLQCAIAPVLIGMGTEVSLVAPLANVVLMMPLSAIVGAGFVFGVATLVAPGWGDIGFVALVLPLDVAENVCIILARLPWAVAAGDGWSSWHTVAWLGVLFLAPWTHRRRERPLPAWASITITPLALGAVLAWALALQPPLPPLRIWFLDVGQGDAILVQAENGDSILVDTGPRSGIADRLRRRGVRSLKAVVATHADGDHIGGLGDLIREMPVGQLLVGGSTSGSDAFRDAELAVAARLTPVATVLRGATIELGPRPVVLRVLHPDDSFAAGDAARNDSSVVLLVEGPGGFRVLLTGDAEAAAEASMLAAGVPLAADVLKAGHHGARNSTGAAFLAAVGPQAAVVSAGIANSYGHPHPELLARLEHAGVAVLRTDLQGTIRIDVREDGTPSVRTAR
jgi:competence protein ComEC